MTRAVPGPGCPCQVFRFSAAVTVLLMNDLVLADFIEALEMRDVHGLHGFDCHRERLVCPCALRQAPAGVPQNLQDLRPIEPLPLAMLAETHKCESIPSLDPLAGATQNLTACGRHRQLRRSSLPSGPWPASLTPPAAAAARRRQSGGGERLARDGRGRPELDHVLGVCGDGQLRPEPDDLLRPRIDGDPQLHPHDRLHDARVTRDRRRRCRRSSAAPRRRRSRRRSASTTSPSRRPTPRGRSRC